MVAVEREVECQYGLEEVFWKTAVWQPFWVNLKLVYPVELFGVGMMIRGEQNERASSYRSQYELLSVSPSWVMWCPPALWDSQVGVAMVGGVNCGSAFPEEVGEEVHNLQAS